MHKIGHCRGLRPPLLLGTLRRRRLKTGRQCLAALSVLVLMLVFSGDHAHAHAVQRCGGARQGPLPPIAFAARGRPSSRMLRSVVHVEDEGLTLTAQVGGPGDGTRLSHSKRINLAATTLVDS